jgi:hypothetical protein
MNQFITITAKKEGDGLTVTATINPKDFHRQLLIADLDIFDLAK